MVESIGRYVIYYQFPLKFDTPLLLSFLFVRNLLLLGTNISLNFLSNIIKVSITNPLLQGYYHKKYYSEIFSLCLRFGLIVLLKVEDIPLKIDLLLVVDIEFYQITFYLIIAEWLKG